MGPLVGGCVPFRVLGHAVRVVQAVHGLQDRGAPIDRVVIFSSAQKARVYGYDATVPPVAALAGAMLSVDPTLPIECDVATGFSEVPVHVDLTPEEDERFTAAKLRSRTGADPRTYATEHSAPSMFADLGPIDRYVITIGAETEALFWSVRARVREAARRRLISVSPAIGVILTSCRLPWYAPIEAEPSLRLALALDDEALDRAVTTAVMSNFGVKSELRASRAFLRGRDRARIMSDLSVPAMIDRCVIGPNLRYLL